MERGTLPVEPRDLQGDRATWRRTRKLAKELGQSTPNYHVAVVEGQIVGMCWLCYRPSENRVQFRLFYVHPRWQGHGVGSDLMAYAKQWVGRADDQPAGLFLYTGAYNVDAIAKYEHWGFTRCGPEQSVFNRIAKRKTSAEIEWIRMNLDF